MVIAKSFARIDASNPVNVGVLPLGLVDPADYDKVQSGDELQVEGLREVLETPE